MKEKKRLILLVALLSALRLCAQFVVTGNVVSKSNNEPLIGATVVEYGTQTGIDRGTTTDFDGNFELEVSSANAQITISYVGFAEQVIPVNGQSTLKIVLEESGVLIDQVVVVGYGVQKKSDLTGSVATLKGEEIQKIATPNFAQAIQGKIAGVYASPTSGKPGEGAVIRIRGTGTLNNSNPLYVIDGMITYDADFLNPQDIESIEVLKDASAAAIYGSRGANGVIIITTKSGRKNQGGEITFSAFTGTQEPTRYIDLLNGSEFARAFNQLRGNNYYPDPESFGEGTDWQKEVFRTAPLYSAQLGVSGGNEAMSYSLSGNYFSQDGIMKNTSYDRVTVRLNTVFDVKPWLSFGNNAAYSITESQNGPNVVGSAYRMPPLLGVFDDAGNFTDPTFFGLATANPAADQFYKSNNFGKGSSLLGNLYGEIKFLKNFRFRSNFGYDFNKGDSRYFEPKFAVSGSQLNLNDRLSVGSGGNNNWIWEQTLNYNKDFGQHSVGVLLGYTAEERSSYNFGGSRENFPGTADELLYLSSGNDTTQMNSGGASAEALNSLLFRTNYTYASKYLMTVSMRVDKSSRFTEDNRTGYFPSLGLGWNAGMEEFIQNLDIFDRLKFKASIGVLGNQAISNRYPTAALVSNGLYAVFGPGENINQGATVISAFNTDLRWESSRQTDVGLEAGFLDGRLTTEIDWYSRNTYDIIADVPIPQYVGSAANPFVNTASVLNTGWDISLNWREAGTFTYSFGANISPVKNEVLQLAKGKTEIFSAFINGEPATRTVVGAPIGGFYGFKVEGIFQSEEEIASSPRLGNEKPGDIKYADINNDGVVDGDDRVFLGSPIPTLTYGFNFNADWKGIDITADLFGVSGNKVFNQKATARFGVYNWEARVADAWTVDNPSQSEPRVTNGGHNYRVSDRYVEDGSFVRLRNVSLGYTLPNSLTGKLGIGYLRVYVSGTNLWTSQKYSGYTPEFPNSGSTFNVGFDNGSYPIARSIQFGLSTKI
ncbi:MAG: TonB-dependent receptor [Saprospiraceae bacterium]|nr:TonB-dependent receptor [Saprospiraceae bacterium]